MYKDVERVVNPATVGSEADTGPPRVWPARAHTHTHTHIHTGVPDDFLATMCLYVCMYS